MQQELIDILRLVINYSIEFKKIQNKLKISERQLKYRLDKINDILVFNKLESLVIENGEIILKKQAKNFILEFINDSEINYEYNEEERIFVMFLMLFLEKEFIDIYSFIYYLKASRSTVNNNLKILKQDLLTQGIDLVYTREEGYLLKGDEFEIRKYLTHVLMDFISIKRNTICIDKIIEEYHLPPVAYLKLIVAELMDKHQVVFVGNKIDELVYLIVLLKTRITNIKTLSDSKNFNNVEIHVNQEVKEFRFVKELYKFLNLDVEYQEFLYLYVWIVSTSIGNYHDEIYTDSTLIFLIKEVMNHFKALSASTFDNYDEAFTQLYSHFKPAYFRLMYNLPIYNPLTNKIKNEYFELYSLVKKSLEPFGRYIKKHIPDDEVAFLTMHFATFFKINLSKDKYKFKAAVICTNGIAGSLLLYNELTKLMPELDFDFPMDYLNFKKAADEYDIIFTTYNSKDLYHFNCPILQVNVVMNEDEKKELLMLVKKHLGKKAVKQIEKVDDIMGVIKKYLNITQLNEQKLKKEITDILLTKKYNIDNTIHLKDLIEIDQIFFDDSSTTWAQLIDKIGKVLVDKNYINDKYLKKINYLSLYDSFVVAPLIAIPHTDLKQEVYKTCISFCVLDKEKTLLGSDKKIRYIFLLAACDSYSHLTAMNELLSVLSYKSFYEACKKKDIEELMRIFNSSTSK